MNPYPTPSSITMQRPGEAPVNITLEDAVVIMTNQQKTIEDLIRNNQKMYQYIQEVQSMGGGGFGAAGSNVQFMQQNVGDPASHLSNAGPAPGSNKPMTLSEYLASKKAATSSGGAAAPAAAATEPEKKPMTLSEYLAAKKASSTTPSTMAAASVSVAEDVPVFEEKSKSEPEVVNF